MPDDICVCGHSLASHSDGGQCTVMIGTAHWCLNCWCQCQSFVSRHVVVQREADAQEE